MKVLAFMSVLLFAAMRAGAAVSVSAAVDQARIAFGESVTFTISVNGTTSGANPVMPRVDGLQIAGPSVNTSVSIVNGQMSQSSQFVYRLTPTRTGEFTIPALDVEVAGRRYRTEPIQLTVAPPGTQPSMENTLFARVRLNAPQVYLGQTAPLDVIVYARANLPVRGLSGFNYEAEGLGFKHLGQIKTGSQTLNGEAFNLFLIEGAISPTRLGTFSFGPAVVQVQVATAKRNRHPFGDTFFDDFFGRTELREMPVTLAPVPIEVLPLPLEGRPADFSGAVGQWNVEVSAKPTEVTVGDPITLTVKITGEGNLDTVPPISLGGLDKFKLYNPTTKTTKNDLNTAGERVFEQVLVPKDATVTELPAVRLTYFDPIAKTYKTAKQGPIPLVVKADTAAPTAIVAAGSTRRPKEQLGQDIVYLKGVCGAPPPVALAGTRTFWLLNLLPVVGLGGALVWKHRQDRLRRDVAYARRSRAARRARRNLARAKDYDQLQRVLQEYLGDRLNIPSTGITASVVEEHRLPDTVRMVFEACDAARFAGATADKAALQRQIEQVIDELERATF